MQYEYTTVALKVEDTKWGAPSQGTGLDEMLNTYGKVGWELVSVSPVPRKLKGRGDVTIAFFRRPL